MVFLPPSSKHMELLSILNLQKVKRREDMVAKELVTQIIAAVTADMVESCSSLRVNYRVLN